MSELKTDRLMAREPRTETQPRPAPTSTGKPRSLIERFANRYDVEPAKLMTTLKATAFSVRKDDPPITDEQMMALLIVAEQYRLNPWTKEIYAFVDKKKGGVVPVVSIDGWARIVNEHPQFDGVEFGYADTVDDEHKHCPVWIECTIYRKDRAHAAPVREYFDECFRKQSYTNPWDTHPKRFLRHKAFIQAARIGFGFAGIYDADEASRVIEGEVVSANSAAWADVNKQIEQKPAQDGSPQPLEQLPITRDEMLIKIQKANNMDELAEAQDLIGEFNSAKDRKILIDAVTAAEAKIGSAPP